LIPLILAETLGTALGSVNQAMIVGLMVSSSAAFKAGAAAMGYPADFSMIEAMYKDILAHPQGLILSRFQHDNFSLLKTEDKKLALKIDELVEPMQEATIEKEMEKLKMPDEFPLILHSGLHHETVANSSMRNPEWNKDKRCLTMLMNEADADSLKIADGDMVVITTRASSAEVEVEVSRHAAPGCVYIRHGQGLVYKGVKYGVNVNELVLTTDRDEMCTPMHRRIPCRVEKG
jgi:anaerobic selenocysteine-containing dehydrogenase